MASLKIRRVNGLALNTRRYFSQVAACASVETPRPLLKRDYGGESSPVSCKVAIVTGGARGIGYHISDYLLQAGAKAVILGDVLIDELEEATCKLNSKYGENKALFQPCDVTKKAEMEKMFKCTKDKFGKVDIVVNNAGIAQSDWERMININVNGVVLGTLLGFQHMGCHEGGKGGSIINVASIFGLQPLYSMPVYCGTKWFVIGLSRSMGTPFFKNLTNVKVMAMCPGVTDTVHVKEATAKLPTLHCLNVEAKKSLNTFSSQGPEEVGRSVIEMLKDGENGSVWVSEGCETYKVAMPDRSTFKPPTPSGAGTTSVQGKPKPPIEKKSPPPDASKAPKKATSPKDKECEVDNSCHDPKYGKCPPKKPFCKRRRKEDKEKDDKNHKEATA